ncbi:hypothetical protein VFPPC_16052 [Pochonia chlamydosporia 170]|uniref:Uncharacterized protein n=1 Tax=Pochonia chlamydosporia 170 TaxID=1380566 RepID=A0A179FLW6_METCM|nr:hypothetical protein VFPPC_16052 [Pochonia chlamydosporia 170]OAQ66625.1 hypothetical protein VFPPC_16052 [Pochonia chlamydosporia 170]
MELTTNLAGTGHGSTQVMLMEFTRHFSVTMCLGRCHHVRVPQLCSMGPSKLTQVDQPPCRVSTDFSLVTSSLSGVQAEAVAGPEALPAFHVFSSFAPPGRLLESSQLDLCAVPRQSSINPLLHLRVYQCNKYCVEYLVDVRSGRHPQDPLPASSWIKATSHTPGTCSDY